MKFNLFLFSLILILSSCSKRQFAFRETVKIDYEVPTNQVMEWKEKVVLEPENLDTVFYANNINYLSIQPENNNSFTDDAYAVVHNQPTLVAPPITSFQEQQSISQKWLDIKEFKSNKNI